MRLARCIVLLFGYLLSVYLSSLYMFSLILVCMAIAESRFHSLPMPEPKPVADGIDLTSKKNVTLESELNV